MRFSRSDEQTMFAEGARRLLADRSSPDRLRQLLDEQAEWDATLWAALAESGALGAAIPEEHGGLGLGFAELAVVAHEIGRANAAVPFASSVIAAAALVSLGSEDQKARWLPRLAAGEAVGCMAWADSTPDTLASNGDTVSGSIPVVADAGIADFALVERAGRLLLVELSSVQRLKLDSFDQLRGFYLLEFDNCFAAVLPGSDQASIAALRDRAAVLAAFEAIGGTDACIDMARDYALERQMFGRPLASYQAIKHKLADIKAARELAFSAATGAAFVADNDPGSLAAEAASARLTAIAAFESAARENQQIHGGIGYTWEANCHFYYRRERAHAATLRGREYWAARLLANRPQPSQLDQTALDSTEEAAFRREARDWLAGNAPDFARPKGAEWDDVTEASMGRAWQARLFDGGYASILLPEELGGRGGSLNEALIFMEEEGRYRVPKGPYIGIGLKMALPVIARHGTSEQITRFTTPTLKGELLWCQLFSEPAAGSDLAALRTRAVRDGDDWVVNGQKVWSSWAHHSDWAILLTRTDPTRPKHKGLTFFVLDMKSPGIEVRPIRQISGASDFNETFLTDVRIPDSCRIGSEGEGWACAMTVLMGERLGAGAEPDPDGGIRGLIGLAERTSATGGNLIDNNHVSTRLGEMFAHELAGERLTARLREMISHGDDPGALGGAVKLTAANRMQQSAGFAMEMLGSQGVARMPGETSLDNAWRDYVWAVALRVAGGADEVLRNQIAERVLGMPGEIRADKNVPFQDLK